MWYNKYRKGKGDGLMERKIQNKEEFLAAIKKEKERPELEKKKKLQTLIQKGR